MVNYNSFSKFRSKIAFARLAAEISADVMYQSDPHSMLDGWGKKQISVTRRVRQVYPDGPIFSCVLCRSSQKTTEINWRKDK